jgi:hypothetical protein
MTGSKGFGREEFLSDRDRNWYFYICNARFYDLLIQ